MAPEPSVPPRLPVSAPDPATPPYTPLVARTLPPQSSLEQVRKQAKDFLDAIRRGDPDARARLEHYFPATPADTDQPKEQVYQAPRAPTLSQAQLAIAREYGFTSWARLRRAVTLRPLLAQLEQLTARPIRWPVVRGVMHALAEAGATGMEAALEALSHPHPDVRRWAIGFLDHHATDACVPQLADLALHDPAPDVRRSAVHALVCDGCKQTPLQMDRLPLLVHAFRRDPNRRNRFNAALPLSRHAEQPLAQEAFRVAIREDPSSLVRRAAVGGLRGDDVLPLLASVAQHDSDLHVRVAAARRLDRKPYRHLACQVLTAALQASDRPQVRRDAHQALKRLSPEYRQAAAQQARDANRARAEPAVPQIPR